MRKALAPTLVIIGLLFLAVGIPGVWVQNNIVSSDGFVALNRGVGTDDNFRTVLVTEAVDSVGGDLQAPQEIIDLAQRALSTAVKDVQSWPEYPAAFDETIRSSHAALFPEDGSQAQPQLALDITPIVSMAVQKLVPGVDLQGTQRGPMYQSLSSQNPSNVVNLAKSVGSVGLPLAIAGGVMLVIGIAIGVRKGTMMVVAGIGGLLVAGAHWLVIPVASTVMNQFTSSNELANAYIAALMPSIERSLGAWVVIEALVAGGLLVVGIVLNLLFKPSAGNRRVARMEA